MITLNLNINFKKASIENVEKIILIPFIVLILVGVFTLQIRKYKNIRVFSHLKLSRNSIKMRKNVNHNLKGFQKILLDSG